MLCLKLFNIIDNFHWRSAYNYDVGSGSLIKRMLSYLIWPMLRIHLMVTQNRRSICITINFKRFQIPSNCTFAVSSVLGLSGLLLCEDERGRLCWEGSIRAFIGWNSKPRYSLNAFICPDFTSSRSYGQGSMCFLTIQALFV